MLKKDNILFTGILVTLVVANTALDYVAFSEVVCDVDAFGGTMGFGNLTAFIMALGTALVLMGLPYKAATAYLPGKKSHWIPLLCGCALIAAAIAGLRLAGLAGSNVTSISGEGTIGADLESVVAVALMFVMSAGESILAFFHKLGQLKEERAGLHAALARIEADIEAIAEQKLEAAKMVNERMFAAVEMCKQANEEVLQAMLAQSEGMQDSFIGYATEGKKARAECAVSLEKGVRSMMISSEIEAAQAASTKESVNASRVLSGREQRAA